MSEGTAPLDETTIVSRVRCANGRSRGTDLPGGRADPSGRSAAEVRELVRAEFPRRSVVERVEHHLLLRAIPGAITGLTAECHRLSLPHVERHGVVGAVEVLTADQPAALQLVSAVEVLPDHLGV